MKHPFTLGLLALAVSCLLTPVSRCQEPERPEHLRLRGDEVDQSEILRWGDRAVVSGEGPGDDADVLYSMAMATPADDSDQWYVTVWGHSKDPATLQLVQAFERDPHLAAFVAAPPSNAAGGGQAKRPWAHFNVYKADDPLQKWRFEKFAVPLTGPLPIVTIQPPRDGSFGGVIKQGNETRMVVVDRIEASQLGSRTAAVDPQQLARRIQASVALWCQKLKDSGFTPPAKLSQRFYGEASRVDRRLAQSDSHGQFPWGPQEPPPQTQIFPQFPAGGPAANPTAPSGGGGMAIPILSAVVALLGMGQVVNFAFTIWAWVRAKRKAEGKDLIVPDDMFELFKKFATEHLAKK